jgi:hypothetical protein
VAHDQSVALIFVGNCEISVLQLLPEGVWR